MHQHWGPIFTSKPCSQRAIDTITAFAAQVADDFSWILTFDEFMECLSGLRDSAPGPDGIPYSAWLYSTTSTHHLLYDLYIDFITTGHLPPSFNHSNLVFLPKGSNPAASTTVSKHASNTRPLNLTTPLTKSSQPH